MSRYISPFMLCLAAAAAIGADFGHGERDWRDERQNRQADRVSRQIERQNGQNCCDSLSHGERGRQDERQNHQADRVSRQIERQNRQTCCESCGISCSSCELCEHTVMVPMMVTETRMQTAVVKNQVEREETYTIFQRVPVKRTYTRERCYLQDEVRTKTITEEKCHIVSNTIVSEFPVQVPVTEVRKQIEQREVCTEDGVAIVNKPCECEVAVMQEEWRSATCCKEDVVFEKTTRDIDYCVRVPKTHKYVCAEETEYKLVPVEKTRKVTVCVPEVVQVPEEVTVCKLVPQTMQCCEQCCRQDK